MARIAPSASVRESWVHGSEPDVPRPLPSNTEAEQALLGAIFRNNLAHSRVADFLLPEHFSFAVHARIYEAVGNLIETGKLANPVTLKNVFENDPALKEIDGAQYLTQLAERAVTIMNAEDYGRRIYDCYVRRQLIAAAQDLIEDVYEIDLTRPAATILTDLEARLFNISSQGGGARPIVTIGEAASQALAQAEEVYKNGGRTRGLETGLHDLDRLTTGLYPGQLIILGARPSMGKTSIADNIAEYMARENPGVFFQLEQSAEEMGQRSLAGRAHVSASRLRRGDVDMVGWQELTSAVDYLSGVPLYIDDTPGLTLPQIKQRLRSLIRRHGVKFAVIDHLGLIRWVGRSESRRLEIASLTYNLKMLARELEIPIILLLQLSRDVERRDNKRPMLADLIESGSNEADADVVLLLWREEYYLEKNPPTQKVDENQEKFNDRRDRWKERLDAVKGLAEVVVAKQRMGPTGLITLAWDEHRMRFESYQEERT